MANEKASSCSAFLCICVIVVHQYFVKSFIKNRIVFLKKWKKIKFLGMNQSRMRVPVRVCECCRWRRGCGLFDYSSLALPGTCGHVLLLVDPGKPAWPWGWPAATVRPSGDIPPCAGSLTASPAPCMKSRRAVGDYYLHWTYQRRTFGQFTWVRLKATRAKTAWETLALFSSLRTRW